MANIKQLLKNPRIIILIIFLVMGTVAINPQPWNEGVSIKTVTKNSSAALAGIEPPKSAVSPMNQERILALNGKTVSDIDDYYAIIDNLEANTTLRIKTDANTYTALIKPLVQTTRLNETEQVEVVSQVNETLNITVNGTMQQETRLVNKTTTEERPLVRREIIGVAPLGLTVADAPTTNLRKGLDLQGGTRVILKPKESVDVETIELIVDSLKQRLNVYGLGDVRVTHVSDRPELLGEGQRYILVEIAGATEEEVRELVAKQGKFEASIANQTVFSGGNDITYVCRTAECSGIDPQIGCGQFEGGWSCNFRFAITLSPEAARRQGELTSGLRVIGDSLEHPLVLYLDGEQVDELQISSELKGRAETDISITGSGQGTSQENAVENTLQNMKRLQTLLITGSLPVKLQIERIDNISPTLGKEFLQNAFLVGLISIIVVVLILIISYRNLKAAIPILITSLSEVYLVLAMAALIGWNLDLAAIAGIILAVGTGVDDQIVILDEVMRGESYAHNWKEKLKRAFFIIMSAYFTTIVAMMPLLFAGAGLLKGFAITTILGVSVGVFVTRPAFAAIAQWIVKN